MRLSKKPRRQKDQSASAPLSADLADSDIDAIDLQRFDEAAAVARPEEIGAFYVERELEALGKAQPSAWRALGDRTARSDEARARATEAAADDQTCVVELDKEVARESQRDLLHVRSALGPYARRTKKDSVLYYVKSFGLIGGDAIGITGAAISMGEVPALAAAQGVAAGIAALSAGGAGAELRDIRDARRRKKDLGPLAEKPAAELSATEQAQLGYAHEFRGSDTGESVGKLVLYGGAAVALLLTTSILGLRSAVNGPLVGMVFGGLAGAIALASAMNTYNYTNSASDLIEARTKAYADDRKRLLQSSRGGPRAEHARSAAAARSIRTEHERLGQAAKQKLASLSYRVLRNNTGVAGHGYAAQSTPGLTQLRLVDTTRRTAEITAHPSSPDGDGKRPGA